MVVGGRGFVVWRDHDGTGGRQVPQKRLQGRCAEGRYAVQAPGPAVGRSDPVQLERPRNGILGAKYILKHPADHQRVGLRVGIEARARKAPTQCRHSTAQGLGYDTFCQVCLEARPVRPHEIHAPSETGSAQRKTASAVGETSDLIHPADTSEHTIYAADLACHLLVLLQGVVHRVKLRRCAEDP
jgi:hypothetical protein